MKIDGINNLFLTPNKKSVELAEKPDAAFTNWLSEKVIDTNDQLNAADHALTELASGRTENLHHTMLTLEQAKISFQYLEQIRNRLMSAYQDLLREQI